MQRPIFTYIISLLLVAGTLSAQQTKPADTTKVKQPFGITALRLGIDLNPWVQSITSSEKSYRNIHTRIEAQNWGLMLDFNHSQVGVSDSTTYSNNANFVRMGIVYNLLKNEGQGNLFYLGAGYGRSWFSERFEGQLNDPIYGNAPISKKSDNLQGGWLEATAGIQARIWKQLFAGYELRLRFAPHFSDDELVQLYQVPGYGRASDKSQVGFAYYLLYRFPLSK